MSIEQIVAEVFRAQVLSREMQGQLTRMLAAATEVSPEDYRALAQLRSALVDGSLQAVAKRQFRNVMEELVWEELERVAPTCGGVAAHFHEIVAYALNRLPPLYATSEVGVDYQRGRAEQELRDMVAQRVAEAMQQARAQPDWHPERAPVSSQRRLLDQMGTLLQQHAREFEAPAAGTAPAAVGGESSS